eukprot:3195554-Alexandrium_andersonii.AAC.1
MGNATVLGPHFPHLPSTDRSLEGSREALLLEGHVEVVDAPFVAEVLHLCVRPKVLVVIGAVLGRLVYVVPFARRRQPRVLPLLEHCLAVLHR